jgi:hypothetical protein
MVNQKTRRTAVLLLFREKKQQGASRSRRGRKDEGK